MKQTPATDLFNQTLFAQLPKDLNKILEIGTGSGAMAKAYREVNNAVNYIGVEIDEAYRDLSQRYCNKTYLENFEVPSEELLSEIIDTDAVIFSDVLEHMHNPWKVLELLSKTIKPSCKIFASIPNIQHWSIQARLLNGEFEYSDTGLLDRTHIRFFTRKTMIDLFEKNGLSIKSLTPRIFNFPNQDIYLEWIKNAANMLNVDSKSAVSDAAAFQFVIEATR
jgi:2-polyprenyl-3-methyl-5-hydroxy-6-metoxy-1,4-benzoquinol methylase